MNEVFARRDLIDPAKLRGLCAPSNIAGAMQALSHIGAVLLIGGLLWQQRSGVWAVPLLMAHGILLNFLYAGQHELSHWTVFRTAWPNEWLGRLFGFVVFYPRTFDQIQHIAHHRFTQDWARDGELNRDRYTRASFILWMSGLTYWYTRWRRILRFSFGVVTEPYLPATRHAELIREARLHLAGYALIAALSVALRSWAAVLLWLAPMLAMKPVHQLQNTIEHLGLTHDRSVLINTRSTRTNAAMRWLCWQMQYHTAHHAFPGVPFHRLRELNHEIFTSRGTAPPSMTYAGFLVAALRAFSGGRSEGDYPDDRAWIAEPRPDGGKLWRNSHSD
jgi:fatty acid desaturase